MADNTWNGKLSKCISCPNTPKVSKTVNEQTQFVKNLMVKSYFCPRSTDTLHFFDKDFKKGGRHKPGFRDIFSSVFRLRAAFGKVTVIIKTYHGL